MRAAAPGFRDPPGHSVQPRGRVEGIDPSPPMIDYAAGRGAAHCTFTVAAAEALPFEAATFDVVTSTLVIHHITPGNRATALAEMARVLRPGGHLLVADFRPPVNPVAAHLISALAGHAMAHNPIGESAAAPGRRCRCRIGAPETGRATGRGFGGAGAGGPAEAEFVAARG